MNKWIIFLVVGFLFSCALRTGPRYPKGSPGSRVPPVTTPTKESAERVASNSLIEEGRQALERGLYDRSADLFQESVTVDPSNGVGYYYLALVKLRTGEYGEVSGLLEKAESLLVGDPQWTEKLEELRKDLHQNKPD